MKRCNVCGSIYKGYLGWRSEEACGCPMCNPELSPIAGYHSGEMEMKKVGKVIDSHNYTIHLGVELECDSFPTEEKRLNAAKEIFKTMNKKNQQFIKLERDGSLSNGFEIISQPVQLCSHMYSMKWKEAFQIINKFGGGSHNSGNCGLHVHLDAFSPSFVKNIWYLVNKAYREDLQVFSRRSPERMRYCAFDNNSWENRMTGHCCAVNTGASTGRTVEIRIFRGTTKYETFIETLHLVERLAWLALDYEDVSTVKLPKFDSLLKPYGKKYMKERRERAR